MAAKHKHLELIQGVVNRLASDSFRLKGWSVVLVSAILVLAVREKNTALVPVALIPVLAFWGLDGYFLWQERLFRALYDHVRRLDDKEIDYAMNVGPFRTVPPRTWPGATFSITLIAFHGALVATVVAVLFL